MTRAQYQAKYGVAPSVPVATSTDTFDTSPAVQKMTRAEYEAKYGVPVGTKIGTGDPLLDANSTIKAMGTNANAGKSPALAFGNPLQDIQQAEAQAQGAITGENQGQGVPGEQSAAQRGVRAASEAATGAFGAVAGMIPGAKSALGLIGNVFGKAVDTAGGIGNTLADLSQKIGIMSPEQRTQYDLRVADFEKSTAGQVTRNVSDTLNNLGNIANTILAVAGPGGATEQLKKAKDTIPGIRAKMAEPSLLPPGAQAQIDATRAKTVSQTADEIAAVENNYVSGRKANAYSKDSGAASRERIAGSNVLDGSVNNDGLIQTKQKGGAVDRYREATIKPAEGVVRNLLEREGSKTNLKVVEKGLLDAVNGAKLTGADLVTALNGVKKQMAGLRLKADVFGDVPNTLLHDAKINEYGNINFQTPPEVATYRKALARGYKTIVEKNSNVNIGEINKELAKYYDDITRLENIDGKRVKGSKFGKYTAQISGNIVGGTIGGAIGGPVGMAIGTVVGGETAGLIKGQSMASTFTKVQEGIIAENPILKKAVETAASPRLQLKAGSGVRSEIPSGKTINLPAKSPSTVDAQSKSLGNRNTIYQIPKAKSSNVITTKTTTTSHKSQSAHAVPQITVADTIRYKALSAEYNALPKDQILDWPKLQEYKTLWKEMTAKTNITGKK